MSTIVAVIPGLANLKAASRVVRALLYFVMETASAACASGGLARTAGVLWMARAC